MKIILFTLILLSVSFIPSVFAASGITSGIANDPDDGDSIYSVGDVIIITFPAQVNGTFASGIMSNDEFRANFTVTNSDMDSLDTITGVWDNTATILTLTIETILGSISPIIDTDTIAYDTTLGNIHYNTNGTEITNTPVTLTGDFGLFVSVETVIVETVKKSGGGCSGDCEEPTLGVNNDGRRLVDNGFTYNGNSIDVERFFTPYPLVTVDVGEENIAEFKIYDNSGSDGITHFELAFGLAKGESIGKSKAVINWDKSWNGIETVTLDDPENVLDNVTVSTLEGSCSDDSETKCLIVKVAHTFRAPLDFNILGTNVWDAKRNAWQNYYNHGIEVTGESLNPPKTHDGINRGHIYHLTENSKGAATDEFGNSWTLNNNQWSMDYIPIKKEIDKITMHGYDRDNSNFKMYKYGQLLLAETKLVEICPHCNDEPYDKINNIFAYDIPVIFSKLNDPQIQSIMKLESDRAEIVMNDLQK